MAVDFRSTETINVQPYISTLQYEMMKFNEDLLQNLVYNTNIKFMFNYKPNDTFTSKIMKDDLNECRDIFATRKNIDIQYGNSFKKNILEKGIFYYLLKNRFREVYYSTNDINIAIEALKRIESPEKKEPLYKLISKALPDAAKEAEKTEKNKDTAAAELNNQQIVLDKAKEINDENKIKMATTDLDNAKKKMVDAEENLKEVNNDIMNKLKEISKYSKTLYVLPNIITNDRRTVEFNINKDMNKELKETYIDYLTSSENNIFHLKILSIDGEDLDEFKSRLNQELERLSNEIKNKGQSITTAYNQIIYFVNSNEKTMTFDYFNSNLKLKKEYASELNNSLNTLFRTNQNRQPIRLSSNVEDNSIIKLKSEYIIRGLKGYYKNIKATETQYKKLNDENFKNDIQLLLDAIKNTYLRYTDVNFKKSLSQTMNINTFNIYSRLDNLDSEIIPSEIIPSSDFLYIFLEPGHIAKLGKFQVSNASKNQYFFVVDAHENKKWRDSGDSEQYKNNEKKNEEEEKELIQDAKEAEEAYSKKINAPESRRILVQIRYNYGKIQFKNIQTKLNTPFNGEIIFYKVSRDYERYNWFKINMIDYSLPDTNDIYYYEDTIFDKKSLIGYLQSLKQYTEKTRLPYEFLRINNNIEERKKYADYIYDNFRENINTNMNDSKFVDKIKKNIIDIVFEKNGLIYVKKTKKQTEKVKEKATADNYKIINHKYLGITSKENADIKTEIISYLNTTYNTQKEAYYFKGYPVTSKQDTEIEKITNTYVQPNKTGGFVVIQITKDIISDGGKLLAAAECKQRSRRIKGKYSRFISFFRGGKKTKKTKRKTRKYYRT